jgi:hypothetical protein
LSRITACALGRSLPGACGFVLTSVPSEQLSDHLGPQRILPVGDKQPAGGLVHTALDEPCPQIVVRPAARAVLADRLGRRPTAALALMVMAGAGVLTYSGSVPALVVGYLCGVLFGAAYGTPAVALTAELFPTSIRSAVAGWLVVAGVLGSTSGLWLAGAIADALDSFGEAMAMVCLPAGLVAVLFARLPETRGLELERSAPEEPHRHVEPT